MRYTANAIGLLTRQYRSVLKKCFLINMGLFAIGVMTATPVLADQTYATLAEAIASTATDKTYTLEADENVTANLGSLQGDSLTIDGNNGQYSINGGENTDITVSTGQEITIKNIGSTSITFDENGILTDLTIDRAIQSFIKSNNTDIPNSAPNLYSCGSILKNNGGIANISDSVFYNNNNNGPAHTGNYGSSTGYAAIGGAIYNDGTTYLSGNNTFAYNSAKEKNISRGGAIYNSGAMTFSGTGTNIFIGNYAKSETDYALGGAIYSENGLTLTSDAGNIYFLDNYAKSESGSALGGAIYSYGDITLTANSGNIIFKGNYVQVGNGEKNYNAIYLSKPPYINKLILTLSQTNNGEIFMYDNINGINGYSVNITGDSTGTMHLYNDIKNAGNVNVSNTTLDIGTATVNISKNLTFASDSVLAMTINGFNDGEHGLLNVSDSLTVENGAKLKATLAQALVADTAKGEENRVTLIKVADSADWDNSNGDFTAEHELNDGENIVADSNNMYEFKKSDDEAGTYIVTKLKTAAEIADDEASGNEDSEGSSATTPSTWVGEAAGAWVDNGGYTEGTVAAEVANQLANLAQNDATALVDAIKAIAPTETAVVQETATEDASRVFKNVSAYLRGERDPMGFASGDAFEDVSIWGKAYIGESKISRRGNIAGSEADSKGVILGIEKKLSNTMKVGAGMQYDTTDIDAYRRNIEADSVQGFVYGEYKPNNWFINGVVAYGESDYDERKYALGTHFDAKYDVDITSVATMTGYQFKYFTPEAGLRYYHIKQNGYTDTAGQHVKGDKSDILRGVAGVRVAKDLGAFRPEAYLGITYDLASDKGNTTVNLANGSNYTVPGKRLDKLGYEASLGLALTLSDNLTASVSYLGAYRENYREHTGIFNVKYNF